MIKYFAAMLGALLLALPAMGMQHHKTSLTEGEVRKIDKEAKKITIKHGPILNLDMPAMTMAFQVKDLTMLEMVKAGDKIRFEAQKLGGAFTVTTIERVN